MNGMVNRFSIDFVATFVCQQKGVQPKNERLIWRIFNPQKTNTPYSFSSLIFPTISGFSKVDTSPKSLFSPSANWLILTDQAIP